MNKRIIVSTVTMFSLTPFLSAAKITPATNVKPNYEIKAAQAPSLQIEGTEQKTQLAMGRKREAGDMGSPAPETTTSPTYDDRGYGAGTSVSPSFSPSAYPSASPSATPYSGTSGSDSGTGMGDGTGTSGTGTGTTGTGDGTTGSGTAQ